MALLPALTAKHSASLTGHTTDTPSAGTSGPRECHDQGRPRPGRAWWSLASFFRFVYFYFLSLALVSAQVALLFILGLTPETPPRGVVPSCVCESGAVRYGVVWRGAAFAALLGGMGSMGMEWETLSVWSGIIVPSATAGGWWTAWGGRGKGEGGPSRDCSAGAACA